MGKALRKELLKVPVVVFEKKQIDRQAREANLNTSDYIRDKLGLTKARKTRNIKQEALENPEGDPENAVDVEELARAIYEQAEKDLRGPSTMADSRREAKRRLTEDA